MSLLELLDSAQFVVDAAGHKKAVQLDLVIWEELRQRLIALDEAEQILTAEAKNWDNLSNEDLTILYQESAEEDRYLAQLGLTAYAAALHREEDAA